MNKRILFIAYFYPPLGGPGVQRPLKTIKYLKNYGWEIDVLSVKDIQFHSFDYTLLEESKADNIYYTHSLDIMSLYKKLIPNKKKDELYYNTPEKIKRVIRGLFPIDDKIGWFPFAYKKGLSLLKKKKYDCIFATIGPFTSGVLAYHLSKKAKIPYFVDYRDLWTLHSYTQYKLKFLFTHARNYESNILQSAQGVFITGNKMREKLIAHFGEELRDKIEVVYNGFDEDDFLSPRHQGTEPKQKTILIRYVGNIYAHQNLYFFITTLEQMEKHKEIPENVRFEFIGNYYIETLNLLKSEVLSPYISIIPQVEHHVAVNFMQTADLLLLFLSSNEGESTIPGKIFEYIRVNKHILAMIPENGEPAQILKSLGHKYICNMEDTQKIRVFLNDFFSSLSCPTRDKGAGGDRGTQDPLSDDSSLSTKAANEFTSNSSIAEYSRKNQTDKVNNFISNKLF